MNSGALAELIHQIPYHFNGKDDLANIFFVIALVTYTLSSAIFILRFAWFRSAAYYEIVDNIGELTFFSAWAIAFMVLTSNVALIVSSAWWGGHPFAIVAYVMWWFVMAWNLCLLVWCFTVMIRRHKLYDQRMPTSVIIPAVSVSTVGVTGATVAAYAKGLSAHLAVPVIILGFNWVGIGFLLGLILYVYLFHSFLSQGWPAPDQTATVFILVGPMGQSAAGLSILGSAASTYHRFADYNTGVFITGESAKSLASACTLVALMLNGLGIIWLIFACYAMVERALKKELRWTPAWNAIIFPNSTLATSCVAFAIDMDSPAYTAIVAVFIICLTIVFLVNIVFTVMGIYKGELLIVKEDWRVKKAMEEEKES